MDFIFPHQIKVFAEWFTGEIKIPQGKAYSYDFFTHAPTYEKELILKFEKGFILGKRTVDNHEKITPIIEYHNKESIKARKERMKQERKKKRKLYFKKIFRWLLSGKKLLSMKENCKQTSNF